MSRLYVKILHRVGLILLIWPLLGINKLIVLLVPFKRIAAVLGEEMTEVEVNYTAASIGRSEVLGYLIRRCSVYTPWQSKCYVQSLTAIELMKLFHIPGTIYFGINREDESKALKAHSWVKHGEVFVTGQAGHEMFSPVAWWGMYKHHK